MAPNSKMFLAALAAPAAMQALEVIESDSTTAAANPIRKVVNMLEAMQKKVEEEGEKEKQLYKKFMCYCETGGRDLEASIQAATDKAPQVEADIKAGEEQKAQLDEDLKAHQADREGAKKTMAEATAIREKEAAKFATEKAELDANIDMTTKAAAAIDKGMAGGFLQTVQAQSLQKLMTTTHANMADEDRQEVLAFLSGGEVSGYSPQSGEVSGILKQLAADFKASLKDISDAEESAIKTYDELMSAKTKEVNALTKAIEEKTRRTGELAVSIVMMKNDLTDTQAALLDDKKYLEELDTSCKTKTKEMDERVKTRAEELVALSETIKILNDDDALELFKKTLPSASASLLEVDSAAAATRRKALSLLRGVETSPHADRKHLDFITLALKGKKIGFDKVIKMVDEMVATLKQEQVDDDNKKEYCNVQLDSMDDKKKGLERSVSDSEAAIADAEEGISTAKDEIKTLEAGIKALDKSVQEASEQRQSEHAEYTELMASNNAAKELLGFAKNRLNKFYNKALYKPAAKRELTEEEQITVNMGGTLAPTPAPGGIAGTGVTVLAQISAHARAAGKEDPGPPPATFEGEYKKKGEESNGVIAMIDLLIRDLDKELTEAETQEKDSQADYETMMKESAAKRATDTKSLTEKGAQKADLESNLQAHKDEKIAAGKELMATVEFIASLHAECDWLLQYFDVRKEARTSEIEALGKAKAVLSGASFSFVQQKSFLAKAK